MHQQGLRAVTRAGAIAVAAAVLAGCGSPSSSGATPAPPPVGASVGAPCSAATPCRVGLVCGASSKTCALSHATADGGACTLRDECAAGSYCAETGVCSAAAKAGASGDACASDGDCGDALRCALIGLVGVCAAEGAADLGAPCGGQTDCFAGLGCAKGTCAAPPPGAPAFGVSSWDGAPCDPDVAPTTAYFRVPRGTSADGDFYRLPFPNDARTKNGKPDLSGHPTAGSALLGFDLVDRYLRAIEQSTSGFGAYPTVVFRFSGPIDVESFRGVGVVSFADLTPGAGVADTRVPLEWIASSERSRWVCANWLAVRPAEGHPLMPGHTYAVVLAATNVHAAHAAGGGTIHTDADLEAVLSDAPPPTGALTRAYTAFAPLRAHLKQQPASAKAIVNATVFTVADAGAPANSIATAVAALPPPQAKGWFVCGGAGVDPCPDTTGSRGCGAPDPLFDELHALVSLPIFQKGAPPYASPADGGDVDLASAAVVRSEAVCMSLTVPRTKAMPAKGWPVVIYAHDAGGSHRSAIVDGVASLLTEAAAPMSVATPIAVLGIDQVQHGPRRGASTASPAELLYALANPAAALGTSLQGVADQLSLARFAASFDLPESASPTMQHVRLDPAAIGFWGHGTGASYGALAIPRSELVRGAVLSGVSASLVDGLIAKERPFSLAATVPYALEDARGGVLDAQKFNPALAMLQAFLDPVDPVHHARAMTTPPSGGKAHHVLQIYGVADSWAPAATQATYAVAGRLALVAPDATVSRPEDIPEATELAGPLAGNQTAPDGTKVTAAVREYEPGADYDGDFVAFQNPAARVDVTIFFAGLLAGGIPAAGH